MLFFTMRQIIEVFVVIHFKVKVVYLFSGSKIIKLSFMDIMLIYLSRQPEKDMNAINHIQNQLENINSSINTLMAKLNTYKNNIQITGN